ncbi:MAG: Trk family potassium uptake protein [Clostridiales bacterium]|nr:Trk family potassium uptake protein [Clostridiales bacterium]
MPHKPEGLRREPRPEEWLVFGFLGIILLGTLLLALPVSTRYGHSIGLFDSLFTATSAVCVTGLVAVDTGTTFSLFGQAVLLVLIQVGGLGFMVFATRVMMMLGRRISIKNRLLIRESMNGASLSNLGTLARRYLLLALGIEAVGAALLAIRFVPMFGLRRGAWFAVFHAVSAFCNAGFDLFGGFSSLTGFAADPLVLLTVAALIVLGGLGFSVILDVLRSRQGLKNLSLHTRIVLTFTLALLLAGTAFYTLVERGRLDVFNAFFQSVTMRTAGFNSVDLSAFTDSSKLFSSLLMMVGASPASTGGGMKTTTVAVVALLIFSVVKGDDGVNAARRRISADTVRRALAVVALFLTMLTLGTLSLSILENGRFSLADILFECSSAMGTVGVSAIGTPNLCPVSRALLMPMMFLGRVGPLTLAVAMARRQGNVKPVAKFPEEKIMIG